MTKQNLIEAISMERGALHQAIDRLTAADLVRPMKAGKWSIRDVLGHLASWNREGMDAVDLWLRGERPAILDMDDRAIDAWNEREAAKKRDLALVDVLVEFDAAHRAVLDLIRELTEEELASSGQFTPPDEGPLARMIWMCSGGHDSQHRSLILDWRERMGL